MEIIKIISYSSFIYSVPNIYYLPRYGVGRTTKSSLKGTHLLFPTPLVFEFTHYLGALPCIYIFIFSKSFSRLALLLCCFTGSPRPPFCYLSQMPVLQMLASFFFFIPPWIFQIHREDTFSC